MRRRELITLIGSSAIMWPISTSAQRADVPIIGFLGVGSAAAWVPNVAAFRVGLAETEYVEGRNVAIEFRWAEGRRDRLPALAAELVRMHVSAIVATGGPPSILAAMAATKTIPIVFTSGADPVENGFIESLSRPGGNATGVTLATRALITKRLELLHELVPSVAALAFLVNPTNRTAEPSSRDAQGAARALGLQVYVLTASSEGDLDAAFATLVRQRPVALLVVADPLFEALRAPLVALAARYAIPAIYQWREDVAAGGLMSYGASITDMYRLAGVYTGKILKDAKPADLPIEQPTKFELVINLKAAKALHIEVPTTLLALANEVIE